MSRELSWPQNFVDALEEEISKCASRFNISQDQKAALESALEQALGEPFHIDYAVRK